MASTVRHSAPPADLNARRTITVEVPEFLIRALECRLADSNESIENHRLELNDLVEHQLAQALSLADLADLEPRVPGLTAAVSRWVAATD